MQGIKWLTYISIDNSTGAPFDIIHNRETFGISTRINTSTFKEFMETTSKLSIEESLERFDSTNACVFLALDISEYILLSQQILAREEIVIRVQDIIFNRTQAYNKVRDRSKTYEVNDATKLMDKTLVNNGSVQFFSPSSRDLCQTISDTLLKTVSATRQ